MHSMSIKLVTEKQFKSAIWRMEVDEISDTLVLEIRDSDEKRVSFSAISLTTGEAWFENLPTPERWLTGIEVAWNSVLLLHNYLTDTGPVHKGLIAIDEFTGEILWSDYIFAFDHLSDDGFVVYDTRIHPRKLFLKDAKTGATIRIYEPSVYRELRNKLAVPEAISGEELALKISGLHPYGNSAHYLEYNNFRIISLHTLNGGILNQLLLIVFDNKEVYRDLLSNNIQKMQPEAFIMHKNRLIYIKNKVELIVISLLLFDHQLC